jgi:hypothetical protein
VSKVYDPLELILQQPYLRNSSTEKCATPSFSGTGSYLNESKDDGRNGRLSFIHFHKDDHDGTSALVYQPITAVILHGFGDASENGMSAAVYPVVHQGDGG